MSDVIQVGERVWQVSTLLSEVFFVGFDDTSDWVLVDAGFPAHSGRIRAAAAELFGVDVPPQAIVLTHGHFDHAGSLRRLLESWAVPVYAEAQEFPYLTGRIPYPPADPTVGGGCLAWSSRFFPHGPIDVGTRLLTLPSNGTVPQMPGWSWLHTPGHTDGHVSFFRQRDRLLLAGDAVVTTKQESFNAALMRRRRLQGPPAYFTSDWDRARESVRLLASLEPDILATGHGLPLRGEAMRRELHDLAEHFDGRARPKRGRYVQRPAVVGANGEMLLPPDPLPGVMGKWAGAVLAGVAVTALLRRSRGPRPTRRAAAREEDPPSSEVR